MINSLSLFVCLYENVFILSYLLNKLGIDFQIDNYFLWAIRRCYSIISWTLYYCCYKVSYPFIVSVSYMYFLLGFLSLRLSLCFWCFLVSLRSSGFAFMFLHFHIIVVLNLGILVLRQDWQFSCHLNNFQIFLFILFSGNSYS